MKKLFIVLASLSLVPLCLRAEAVLGSPAPEFTARDIDGQTHHLSDYKGKIVVLEEFNLDCPFCANHYQSGAMQELQGYATSKGVVWLLVNSAALKSGSYRKPQQAKKEFLRQKMKATAWLDDSAGTVGKAYGLKTTPHMIVIAQNGAVAYDGAIDDRAEVEGDPRTARHYVREAINKLLAGEPVEKTKSKPYGCGVKYAR